MIKRVLICDDDPDILEVTKLILRSKGFEVETRCNCDDIITLVELIKPDIILMDHKIPELGGIKLTGILKQHNIYGKIPVLIFSANSDIEKIVITAGADGFLRKPFDIDVLENTLNHYIDKHPL